MKFEWTLWAKRIRCRHFNLGKRLDKASTVTKGFWQSLQDVQPDKTYIVAPVQQRWPFADGGEVIGVGDIVRVLTS
ncbi:hypothetical protein [Limnohabitans sp. Jir72]|uniref:hypothetical protein n=1 Tax=Limnohabitans sp. Jir72 TaxID=1977909 RepID=UPI0011B270DF|nr:hypothetical protein [Limnohabitans sp. Jir72]